MTTVAKQRFGLVAAPGEQYGQKAQGAQDQTIYIPGHHGVAPLAGEKSGDRSENQ